MTLPLIIEPEALATLLDQNLDKLLIIDVGQAQTYSQIHVPGAVHVPPSRLVCGIPPAAGKLPSLDDLNQLFSDIGYTPEKDIVVYDDEGGGWAGRMLWTLDVIGHQNSSVLNGGIHAWAKEGHPVSAEKVTPEPSSVSVTLNPEPIATLETVMAATDDPQVVIWDARSIEEYLGTKTTALRNGHIPGAVNLDWMALMDGSRNYRLLPDALLREKLAETGIGKDQRIITHCHSHHRSGLSYLAAKHLGYAVKAYDGSWSEWGNMPDTPIA